MDEKILVVDDSVFARKILIDILNKKGYKNIIEAKDGEESIEMYKKEKPDIILLDVIMPKMDGIKVLQRIMELDSETKIIVISAVGQEKIIEKALEIGAIEYIVKPISEQILTKVLARVLA